MVKSKYAEPNPQFAKRRFSKRNHLLPTVTDEESSIGEVEETFALKDNLCFEPFRMMLLA